MALTPDELRQLRDALTDGIRDGFDQRQSRMPNTDSNGRNIGDYTNPINQRARNRYNHNRREAERQDAIQELEDRINVIQSGDYGNTRAGRKKIESYRKQQDKIKNGLSPAEEKAIQAKRTASMVAGVVNGLVQIGGAVIDIIVAYKQRELDIQKAYLEYNSSLVKGNLLKQGKILATSSNMLVAGFNKNVADIAFDAVGNSYDLAAANVQATQDIRVAGMQFAKDLKQASVNFNSNIIGASVAMGAGIGAIIGSIVPVAGNAVGAVIGAAVGGLIGAIGGLIHKSYKDLQQIEVSKMQLQIEQEQTVSQTMEKYMAEFKTFVEPWDKLYNNTVNFVLGVNKAGKLFSATIGFTSDAFANTMIQMTQKNLVNGQTLARVFGKEAEKIPEYMDAYITTSGRAVGMSVKDIGNIMATGRLFGMSGQESSQLYGSMNVFNTSISSASDSMGVMYHQITRMGLSTKKFGKDLVQNLKLAQRYNFKGGVDNMMKLTKWAQQTRFNLNSAASFADSILDGTLSEALETSARLQVLGGAAAIYSDPLGMLYDAGANVGDLARRQAAMFSDLTGTFNAKTGETEFSWYENKMIRERAKAAGLDVEDVFNQIRQTNKQGVIDKLLGGMDEEDRIAIGNRATYNKKKSRWEVTDIYGNVHDIQDYKDNKASINNLLPKDNDDAMLVIAEKSLSHLERIDNEVYQNMTEIGNSFKGRIFSDVDTNRQTQADFYKNQKEGIHSVFDLTAKQSQEMFNMNFDIMQKAIEHQDIISDIYQGYKTQMYEIFDTGLEDFEWAAGSFATSTARFHDGVSEILGIAQKLNTPFQLPEEIKNGGNSTWEYRETWRDKYGQFHQKIGPNAERIWNNYVPGTMGTGPRHTFHVDSNGVAHFEDEDYENAANRALRRVQDGIVSGNGAISVRTSPKDQYLAAMPNGPIDKILQQLIPGLQALLSGNGGSNNVNLNLNGKLELSQDGSSVNLVELIKNDPAMATKFLAVLQKTMEVNQNGRAIRNRMIS